MRQSSVLENCFHMFQYAALRYEFTDEETSKRTFSGSFLEQKAFEWRQT